MSEQPEQEVDQDEAVEDTEAAAEGSAFDAGVSTEEN